MSELVVHSVRIPAGSAPPVQQDRVTQFTLFGVANLIGGGAGAAVVTAVAVPGGILPANGNYFVDVETSQDCTAFVSGKTANGFNVTLEPRLAANTLAAGTFNVNITC